MIAEERSKKSANLVRGEMEGIASAVDAVNDGAVLRTKGRGQEM